MTTQMNIRPRESILMDFKMIEGVTIPEGVVGTWTIRGEGNSLVHSGEMDTNVARTLYMLRIPSTATDLADGEYDLLVYVGEAESGYGDYIYDIVLKVEDK